MSPDYRLDNPELLGQLRDNTAAEIAAATRVICGGAIDAADAAWLLAVVGLVAA